MNMNSDVAQLGLHMILGLKEGEENRYAEASIALASVNAISQKRCSKSLANQVWNPLPYPFIASSVRSGTSFLCIAWEKTVLHLITELQLVKSWEYT